MKPVKGKTIILLVAIFLSAAFAFAQAPSTPPDQPPPPDQPAQPPAQPETPGQPAQPPAQGEQPGQPAQPPAQPPEAAPPPPPDPVLEAAKEAFRKGEYQAALDSATKVLEGKSEDLEALYVAGVSALRLGDLNAGDAHLNKLLQLEPRMPNIFFHLGHLAFARAEELTKGSRAEEAKAKYAEAAQRFQEEIARAGAEEGPPIQSLQSRALALARSGQHDEAIAAYEAWIAAAPKSARPYLALGSLLAELGRGADAIAILDRLPKDNAKLAMEGSFAIARTLYAKEKYEDTLAFIRKMQDYSLDSRPLHGLVSATYARLGKLQESAEELCRFVSQNPPIEESESVGEVLKLSFGGDWITAKAPALFPKGALPEAERTSRPRYPPEARKDRVETQVMLMVKIMPDGTIGETCTVPSGVLDQLRQYGIEQAAIECVKRWKFFPAKKDKAPVAAYYPAVVVFSLR
jgi:TonB family protein